MNKITFSRKELEIDNIRGVEFDDLSIKNKEIVKGYEDFEITNNKCGSSERRMCEWCGDIYSSGFFNMFSGKCENCIGEDK